MKTINKNICVAGLLMLIACMSSMTLAQRGGRSSFGGSSGGYSAPRSTYSPPRSTYSPPSMRSGGSMGSGVQSAPSTNGQMRSGGSMGSGIKSSTNSSSQMKSSGAMNSTPPKTPPTVNSGPTTKTSPGISSTNNNRPSTSSTQYRYKSYSGPRTTTYNGRNVYVDVHGGYSYFQNGPIIAYMPGYAPVAYTAPVSVVAPNPFWPLFWITIAIVAIVIVVLVIVKN